MSLSVMKEIVVQTDDKKLRTILEEEGIQCEGRIVIVNGQLKRNLDERVPSDAKVVVVSPVAGG